jgi:enolase
MTGKITAVQAMEIIDSRGNPIVRMYIELNDGTCSVASVPSGTSTGKNKAIEFRDSDKTQYLSKGILRAVTNVNIKITPELIDIDATSQVDIDRRMIEIDGKVHKSSLGANSILGVSMAVTKAADISYHSPSIATWEGAEPGTFRCRQ